MGYLHYSKFGCRDVQFCQCRALIFCPCGMFIYGGSLLCVGGTFELACQKTASGFVLEATWDWFWGGLASDLWWDWWLGLVEGGGVGQE